MKIKAGLSVASGFLFGLIGYYVLLLFDFDQPKQLATLCGLLFALALFLFLVVYGKIMDKRYAKFEKEVIVSPIFYKSNGNFNLGNGKVKNGNIYFCEAGIVCVCLEDKPYGLDEIRLQDIERYQVDNIHLRIFTNDGRVILLTTPDVAKIIEVLRQKEWI
ncbi:MAG: hypothetical protein IKA63_03120 [Clostridia bacterium]|nr:hypothetical protein [Clostridia bacterium]MBR4056645.1 hypothetical protein [Oscillospiraceae bacterium]MBR6561622.1 hypothetical protein [Oscillospiraceae bacterium]